MALPSPSQFPRSLPCPSLAPALQTKPTYLAPTSRFMKLLLPVKLFRRDLYWQLSQGQSPSFRRCHGHPSQDLLPWAASGSTPPEDPGHSSGDGTSQGLSLVNCMGEARVWLYQHKPHHITPWQDQTGSWLVTFTRIDTALVQTSFREDSLPGITSSFFPVGLNPRRVCNHILLPLCQGAGRGCNTQT